MVTFCTVCLSLTVLCTFITLMSMMAKTANAPEPKPEPEKPKSGLHYVIVFVIVGTILFGDSWSIYLLWK